GVGEMVVGRAGDLLRLLVDRAGVVLVQALERLFDPPALLAQHRPVAVRVDRAHARLSFLPRSDPVAEASRRSISAGPTPSSTTILSLAVWPETSDSERRGT